MASYLLYSSQLPRAKCTTCVMWSADTYCSSGLPPVWLILVVIKMYVCLCVCATFFLDLILFSVIATKVPDSSQDSDDVVKWPRIVSVNTAQWCFTICQFNGIRESVNSETYIVRFEGEPLLLSINMCRPQLTYITLSKRQKEVASFQGHSPQATPRLYLAAVEKNQ